MFGFLHEFRSALLLTCAAASWGVGTVISKRAVAEIAPLALLPVQLAASVLVLLLLTGPGISRVVWSPGLRRLGALGVLNPGLAYALNLLGLVRITASLSVLLWTLEPLLILVLARLVLGDRVTRAVVAAVALALGGVVLVVFHNGSGGTGVGVALTLAGVLACAVYTVTCRKLLAEDGVLTIVGIQQAVALFFAIALFTAARLLGWVPSIGHVSARGWASAVASGVLYYAFAFWLYLAGLRHVQAAVAGVFINLIPVFGIAAAWLLLGERLVGRQWLGAAVVVLAVTATVLARPRPISPSGTRP